jgi:hypothetical protein
MNTNKTTKHGKYALNELLDHLEKLCIRTYLELLKDGIPKPSLLKDACPSSNQCRLFLFLFHVIFVLIINDGNPLLI